MTNISFNDTMNILNKSIDSTIQKNVESSSMIIGRKQQLIIKDNNKEIKNITMINNSKLDFKALENQMINNNLAKNINENIMLNSDLDLNKELEKNLNDKYILDKIKVVKTNNYFTNDLNLSNNIVTGSIDFDKVNKIVSDNIFTDQLKNELVTKSLKIEQQEQPEQPELPINNDTITPEIISDVSTNIQNINQPKNIPNQPNTFDVTIKWIIVAAVVAGLFIMIFFIIQKNNNKMKNLAKLNETSIKYVSSLSEDSASSFFTDLGTEL